MYLCVYTRCGCFVTSGVGGQDGDGDIFKEDNLETFKNFVLESTDGQGCHFVMGDGVSKEYM